MTLNWQIPKLSELYCTWKLEVSRGTKKKKTPFDHSTLLNIHLMKWFSKIINQAPKSPPSVTNPWRWRSAALEVEPCEWWNALSIARVMGCEQLSSVWIGGGLEPVATQTQRAVLGPGRRPTLPQLGCYVLHAVHTHTHTHCRHSSRNTQQSPRTTQGLDTAGAARPLGDRLTSNVNKQQNTNN